MPQDPLDQPASLRTLRQWYREGIIDEATLRNATARIQPAASWQAWLSLELLVAGVALVMSGIVFFFAYNWQDIGRFEKLGLIQVALVGCIAASCWAGVRTLGGQVLVLMATVMTGVFLAVFGQIYQTGADAYELFTGWAALTLVWVLIARMEALWFLWLAIVQTGIVLFWIQVAEPGWHWPSNGLFYTLAGINAAALIIAEISRHSPRHGWLRVVFLTALLTVLTVPVLDVIFRGLQGSSVRLAYVPVWLVVAGLGYRLFRLARPDFACVAVISANAVVLGVRVIGRVIFSWQYSDDSVGSYLLMSLVIVGASAGLSIWLAREHRAMKHLPS